MSNNTYRVRVENADGDARYFTSFADGLELFMKSKSPVRSISHWKIAESMKNGKRTSLSAT